MYIVEKFKNIDALMTHLSLDNNKVMKGKYASNDHDYDFTGSNSYAEAEHLLRVGDGELTSKLKAKMKITDKKTERKLLSNQKTMPKNAIVGFIPNVPNYLAGRPDSMINANRMPAKVKTIEIVYLMDGNCDTNKDLWLNAGAVLLNAIKIIENKGIRIKIDLIFQYAKVSGGYDDDNSNNSEILVGSVSIKDYGTMLDLRKVAFPLAHPSMLRRIGFKFTEVDEYIKIPGWSYGYGHALASDSNEELREPMKLNKNAHIISAQTIQALDFSVKELLIKLNCLK